MDDSRSVAAPLLQLLEVVEHQEQLFVAQMGDELGGGIGAPLKMDADGLGDARRKQIGGADRGQGDPIDAILERAHLRGGGLPGQPGLAHPARSHQGQTR